MWSSPEAVLHAPLLLRRLLWQLCSVGGRAVLCVCAQRALHALTYAGPATPIVPQGTRAQGLGRVFTARLALAANMRPGGGRRRRPVRRTCCRTRPAQPAPRMFKTGQLAVPGGNPPPPHLMLTRLSAAPPAQATPRRVELPFCLAILLRDKASDGRPLRLVAATAALLFPQQEEVFKASPSIQVPLAVADADGAPVSYRGSLGWWSPLRSVQVLVVCLGAAWQQATPVACRPTPAPRPAACAALLALSTCKHRAAFACRQVGVHSWAAQVPHLSLRQYSLACTGRVWPMTYVLKRSAGGHAARYVAGRVPSLQGSLLRSRSSQIEVQLGVASGGCELSERALGCMSAVCSHCRVYEVVSIS